MANVITPLQRIPGIASDIYSPKKFILGRLNPKMLETRKKTQIPQA
jgi:hypothetical protein